MIVKQGYRVHSCHETGVERTVQIENQTVKAMVPGLIVELVAEDLPSVTLRFIPRDMEAAKAAYAVDAEVAASFSTVATGKE